MVVLKAGFLNDIFNILNILNTYFEYMRIYSIWSEWRVLGRIRRLKSRYAGGCDYTLRRDSGSWSEYIYLQEHGKDVTILDDCIRTYFKEQV